MKPRRRRIKVYATGAHRGALEQPRKCKNKPLFFASAASSISNEPLSPLSLPSLKKKGFRHGLLRNHRVREDLPGKRLWGAAIKVCPERGANNCVPRR